MRRISACASIRTTSRRLRPDIWPHSVAALISFFGLPFESIPEFVRELLALATVVAGQDKFPQLSELFLLASFERSQSLVDHGLSGGIATACDPTFDPLFRFGSDGDSHVLLLRVPR